MATSTSLLDLSVFSAGFDRWCATRPADSDPFDTPFEGELRALREELPHLSSLEVMAELRRRLEGPLGPDLARTH